MAPQATRPVFTGYPFTLGVASGAPSPTGVVLWTRLAPDPLHGGGVGRDRIRVQWEVADDETFAHVVRHGTAEARPSAAHTVHVEVDGLEPDRWYAYRFTAGAEDSPVGRTRTAPAATSDVPSLRFGFGSCQHFEHGYYAAHRHLADEELDLMVFLGDYIYEGAGRSDGVRRHVGGEARTLADYRTRHAQYKTDRDLQRLHAAVPWLVTWDDHEVVNNYAGLREGARERDFAARRRAGYRAYWEHMPLPARAKPTPARMVLRARHDVGTLARFDVLDGRQHRSTQACQPGNRAGGRVIDERCPELRDAARTVLGGAQERWLARGLAGTGPRWTFIAQQTLMARASRNVDGRPHVSSDAWDGYPPARDRLLRGVAGAGGRGCVVLSGDAHTAFVADLKLDFGDPDAAAVAAELCGPSISSRGPAQARTAAVLAQNPHLHYGDSARRGYVVVDVTPERCVSRIRVLDDVEDPGTAVSTAATFVVDAGRPGVHRE